MPEAVERANLATAGVFEDVEVLEELAEGATQAVSG